MKSEITPEQIIQNGEAIREAIRERYWADSFRLPEAGEARERYAKWFSDGISYIYDVLEQARTDQQKTVTAAVKNPAA
jgi:hypothetical protein